MLTITGRVLGSFQISVRSFLSNFGSFFMKVRSRADVHSFQNLVLPRQLIQFSSRSRRCIEGVFIVELHKVKKRFIGYITKSKWLLTDKDLSLLVIPGFRTKFKRSRSWLQPPQ